MLSPINFFCQGDVFGKFQGHSISLSGETKDILNFKNILHFKTASNWSVKLVMFPMSQVQNLQGVILT